MCRIERRLIHITLRGWKDIEIKIKKKQARLKKKWFAVIFVVMNLVCVPVNLESQQAVKEEPGRIKTVKEFVKGTDIPKIIVLIDDDAVNQNGKKVKGTTTKTLVCDSSGVPKLDEKGRFQYSVTNDQLPEGLHWFEYLNHYGQPVRIVKFAGLPEETVIENSGFLSKDSIIPKKSVTTFTHDNLTVTRTLQLNRSGIDGINADQVFKYSVRDDHDHWTEYYNSKGRPIRIDRYDVRTTNHTFIGGTSIPYSFSATARRSGRHLFSGYTADIYKTDLGSLMTKPEFQAEHRKHNSWHKGRERWVIKTVLTRPEAVKKFLEGMVYSFDHTWVEKNLNHKTDEYLYFNTGRLIKREESFLFDPHKIFYINGRRHRIVEKMESFSVFSYVPGSKNVDTARMEVRDLGKWVNDWRIISGTLKNHMNAPMGWMGIPGSIIYNGIWNGGVKKNIESVTAYDSAGKKFYEWVNIPTVGEEHTYFLSFCQSKKEELSVPDVFVKINNRGHLVMIAALLKDADGQPALFHQKTHDLWFYRYIGYGFGGVSPLGRFDIAFPGGDSWGNLELFEFHLDLKGRKGSMAALQEKNAKEIQRQGLHAHFPSFVEIDAFFWNRSGYSDDINDIVSSGLKPKSVYQRWYYHVRTPKNGSVNIDDLPWLTQGGVLRWQYSDLPEYKNIEKIIGPRTEGFLNHLGISGVPLPSEKDLEELEKPAESSRRRPERRKKKPGPRIVNQNKSEKGNTGTQEEPIVNHAERDWL